MLLNGIGFDNDGDSDINTSVLDELSRELFHKQEMENLFQHKIQLERKKNYFNERVSTTSYVLSCRMKDMKNPILTEELQKT